MVIKNSEEKNMSLENELKELVIKGLNIMDVKAEDVADEAPIFNEGLGLDSLDAVELVVLLKKNYKVNIQDMEKAKIAFQSIKTLADYIRNEKGQDVSASN